MFVLRRRVQKDSGVTLRMPTIAGTLVMEQIILGITLVVFVILMIVLLPNVPRQIIDGVIALTGAVVALVVGVIAVELLARWRSRRNPDSRPPAQAASSWRSFLRSVEAVLNGMASGLELLRSPRRGAFSLGAGMLSWAAQLLGIWLTLRAFGIDSHTLGAAAAVFVASNVVGLIQITPGNVGVFQLAVALALRVSYGVDQTTAITFGIGLQVIEVALGAGLGFVFLSLEGLSFGEVRRGMSAAAIEDGDGGWSCRVWRRPAPSAAGSWSELLAVAGDRRRRELAGSRIDQVVDLAEPVRVGVVDLDERLHRVRDGILGEDRLDRAFRLACAAIDAFLGVDHQHAIGLVDAVDRTDLNAGSVLHVDAGLGDDVRHVARAPGVLPAVQLHATRRAIGRPKGRRSILVPSRFRGGACGASPGRYRSGVTAAEFFTALPGRFNPAAAVGVTAIIQFELSGDGGGTWHVTVADGACEVASGPHDDPTLVVVASAENWLKVVAGSLDPQLAFLTGRLKVRGDMGLAMRLRALFL